MTRVNFKTHPENLAKAHSARESLKTPRQKINYVRAGKPIKQGQALPQEVVDAFSTIKDLKVRDSYVSALSNEGWTNKSIATALGKTPETVRRILLNPHTEPLPEYFLVPSVPRHAEKTPTIYTMPSTEVLERLKELQPLAQKVRSNSPRYRAEAEEYTYLLNKAHNEQGVTLYRLAKLLGVTTSALAFRLVRYGYRTTENGKTKAYQLIKDSNRKPTDK